MSELRNTLRATVVLVALMAPLPLKAAPSNLVLASSAPSKPQEFAQETSSSAIDQPPTVSASPVHKKVTSHKSSHHQKHKKKKGKSSHQASNTHHKKVSKKTAAHESHHKKKIAALAHKHPHQAPARKLAEAAKPTAIRRKELAPAKLASSDMHRGINNVAYTFCLGYDNCVPTRYETTGSMTRVVQQNENGDWQDAKIDPVMVSDLNKLASSETSTTVVRSLTDAEKASIATHQGAVHATLVGDIQDGPAKKDEAKALMREMHIHNATDLESYDAKLRNNPHAMEVANELAAEHMPVPGR